MYEIQISSAFKAICPAFRGAAITATVRNSASSPALWSEIERAIEALRARYTPETIKENPGICATRAAYRLAGKDPSRYRPACEQLARRVLQGKELYRVNTLVDLMNLISLRFGYSTAALDADQLIGNSVELDLGREGELYEAIGRGPLNIANLPVYRDAAGAFATPTSDSTRTMLSLETTHVLLLINGYDGDEANLAEAIHATERGLQAYAACSHREVQIYL